MTDRVAPAAEIAPRLHQAAANARELAIDLQRRSWDGGPSSGIEIANLSRAAEHLTDAAREMGWQETPSSDALVRSAASAGLLTMVFAGVLALVPDPGQPGVIVVALIAGWVAADVYGRTDLAVRWRSLAAERVEPKGEKFPAAQRIRQLQATVDEILIMYTADHTRRGTSQTDDAAEDIHAAQLWLDRAAEGAEVSTPR